MELLFRHSQSKNKDQSKCSISLYKCNEILHYCGFFDFEYKGELGKRVLTFIHDIKVNINNGDVSVQYQFINSSDKKQNKCLKVPIRVNDFLVVADSTDAGFYKGEKKINYWGKKYNKATEEIFDIIYGYLSPRIVSSHLIGKLYKEKPFINPLFDLLVDFHLDSKGIKAHDSVYQTIQWDYPKSKWLKKNDFKFLPAILDAHGIKSKYFISELNQRTDDYISIRSLRYLCYLFGDNHIDYIKHIDWLNLCTYNPPNKRLHTLKNESEKKYLIKLINEWNQDLSVSDSLIFNLNELLTNRSFLLSKGIETTFKVKNITELNIVSEQWRSMVNHIKKGYKVKYDIPEDFIKNIEEDIIIDDKLFKVGILKSEDEFSIEGFIMKNCMGKEFATAAIFLYVHMTHNKKRINISFRNGEVEQCFGRGNTTIPPIFIEPIKELTKKLSKYGPIRWSKVKFDFISK